MATQVSAAASACSPNASACRMSPSRTARCAAMVAEPARQVGEESLGRRVRPLQVVDGQQQRRPPRDVRGQPVQPVQHRVGVLVARPFWLDQRPDRKRGRVLPRPSGRAAQLAVE
jgi:hypothetical protein